VRAATLARLLLGTVCLARPAVALEAIGGPDQGDDATELVARVLGGRLVLQGLGDLALGRRLRRADLVIELTHAASMLPAAAAWPRHRRSALASAAVATTIGLLDLVSTPRSGQEH
jgi:hypothetical protein